MGKYDESDLQIEGQMTLDAWLNPEERLIAVSKIFARARKQMTLAEQKTLVYALTQMKFTEKAEGLSVKLDKKALARILGINSDSNHLSVDIYESIETMPQHSYININERDLDLQSNGYVITAVTRLKNAVRIRFNEEYIGLFTGLSANYITMWSSDIFMMSSIRTVRFYEYLRQHMDTRDGSHNALVGVRAFKELFDIPKEGKGSYVRDNSGFNRVQFEKRVIDPLCEDMQHCKMIKLIMQPDGKFYVKEKRGNRVEGYRFFWDFSARPGIAAADEVKKIQERVDADPRVLKVAKDLVNGEKKPKTAGNFEQRSYNFAELERALLGKEGPK